MEVNVKCNQSDIKRIYTRQEELFMKSSHEVGLSKPFSVCPTLVHNELTIYIRDDFNDDFH